MYADRVHKHGFSRVMSNNRVKTWGLDSQDVGCLVSTVKTWDVLSRQSRRGISCLHSQDVGCICQFTEV
eukprot:1028676-Amorphochlora_amoeboformis.AAC.1